MNSPDGSIVYTLHNSTPGFLSLIDTQTLEVVQTVNVGNTPRFFTISPDNKKIYVPNQGGDISVVDIETNEVDTIPLPKTLWSLALTPAASSPKNAQGYQKINRFLTQEERVNVLAWEFPTDEGAAIAGYRIYRDKSLTDLAGKVNADTNRFEDHNRPVQRAYTYYIVSETPFGTLSDPAIVKILPL